MRPLIFLSIFVISLLILGCSTDNKLTAKVIGDPVLCDNGIIDDNETCGNCPEDVGTPEECDLIDNDCDWLVDEGNVCNTAIRCGTFHRSCPVDETCHFGVCGEPVLFLHFDEGEGNMTYDSSGNDYHGSLIDSPVWAEDCKFNGCLDFKGSYDYVILSAQPITDLINEKFTISFWANGNGRSDRPTFGFSNSDVVKFDNPLVSNDDSLTFGNGERYQHMDYLPNTPQHSWKHYAIVDNGSLYLVYVDGKLSHKNEIFVDPTSSTEREFVIGTSGFRKMYADNYDGMIDEFMIYDRALSALEVERMYLSGGE